MSDGRTVGGGGKEGEGHDGQSVCRSPSPPSIPHFCVNLRVILSSSGGTGEGRGGREGWHTKVDEVW